MKKTFLILIILLLQIVIFFEPSGSNIKSLGQFFNGQQLNTSVNRSPIGRESKRITTAFNIKTGNEIKIFSPDYQTCRELFRGSEMPARQKKVMVMFGGKGVLLVHFEEIEFHAIPLEVRQELERKFPEWKIDDASFKISYHLQKYTAEIYLVHLSRNDLSLCLKLNATGETI